MELRSGTPGAPPSPLPPAIVSVPRRGTRYIIRITSATAAREAHGFLFLRTESQNSHTASSAPLMMAGGHEFLVIENSALRRSIETDSKGIGGPIIPVTRRTSKPTSARMAHSWPTFTLAFNGRTPSFLIVGAGYHTRSRVIQLTGSANGEEPGKIPHSSRYPDIPISKLAICNLRRVSPSLHFSSHVNLLSLSSNLPGNRLIKSPLKPFSPVSTFLFTSETDVSCWSAFHTCTATKPRLFFDAASRTAPLFDFEDTVSLPFENLAWPGQPGHTLHVGFSCVSRVWVDPTHHNFPDIVSNCFALKKLVSRKIEDFKRETRALLNFSARPHKHVVRLLAAFRHGDSFYFLFPWAPGGSLRSFWREHPQPVVCTESVTWVAEQCLGVATALHEIHCRIDEGRTLHHDYAQRCASSRVRGYHGDIKAENILLFEGDRYGYSHIWKIGDFGVSNSFLVASRGGDIPNGFTPAYQAPEHHIKGRIDGCADIWSFGCLLLETVVWLLRGWEGLLQFELARRGPGLAVRQDNIKKDCFFDMAHPSTGTVPFPVLKASVLQCIEALSYDQNGSPFLRDLLHLILRYLLDVNKQSRLTSGALVQTLRQLHQQCVHMPAYTVASPRPQKPPLPTKHIYCESNNHAINLSAFSSSLKIDTATRISIAYMASSRNKILQDPSHRDLTMALNPGAPGSSQWLDDFIRELYNPQPELSILTPGHSSDFFQPAIPQETYPSQPNGPHYGRKRGIDCISDSDEQNNQGRAKFIKRSEAFQENQEVNSFPVDASISASTLKPQHHTSPSTTVSEQKMFACPFSKRPEKRYVNTKDWKCCLGSGPGWTIHRLKEHLYRKHASTNYQCFRCLVEFEDVSGLHQHQRSATPCPKNTEAGIERIDAQQMSQIKKRSRRSDEEKWSSIYRIIFRLEETADIPSPYYEHIAPVPNIETSSHHGDDSLSQFQSYLQTQLENCHQMQQNTSTIQACMDLVQGFQMTRGDNTLPASEVPSLVFDSSAFSTMSYEYQPSTSTTLSTNSNHNPTTSHGFDGPDMTDLNGLGLWDNAFETHFNKVFGITVPDSPPKPLPTQQNFQQREGFG
ncbi:hypothetical protein ANO14919_109630 [Xylariales sp. No.14919]|nr:hypothetical protein ANO14919_109630 [Xylariales sp. No.14919]